MYKILDDSKVVRLSDGKVILPNNDSSDEDIELYLAWIKEGNVPSYEHTPYIEEWEVPSDVFLNKFTQEEIGLALTLRKADIIVDSALLQLTAHNVVNNKNPLTIQLMNILVAKNIISTERKAEILGYE